MDLVLEELCLIIRLGGLPEIAGYILSAIAGVALMIILFKIVSSLKKNKPGSEETENHA